VFANTVAIGKKLEIDKGIFFKMWPH